MMEGFVTSSWRYDRILQYLQWRHVDKILLLYVEIQRADSVTLLCGHTKRRIFFKYI